MSIRALKFAAVTLAGVIGASCSDHAPLDVLANADSKGLECTTIEELFALPEEELDIGRAALVIQDGFAAGMDLDSAIEALDELARGYGQPNEPDLAREARRLLDYLHDECGFVYAADGSTRESRLLARVLENREGNCVGLSTLYLAVAERVGLDLAGVQIPGHMYVTLRRGDASLALDPSTGELFEDFDGFEGDSAESSAWRKKRDAHLMSPRATLGYLLGEAARLADDGSFEQDSIHLAQLATECAPFEPVGYRTLAIVLRRRGGTEEALAAIAIALKLDPNDADARIVKADIHHGIGEQDEALEETLAAIELDPIHPGYHFLAARIHASRFEQDAMFRELDLALSTPWDRLHPYHVVKIMSWIGDPWEFEGDVWGYLWQKHKFAAKRLESIERGGKEIDMDEFRLHMACADLASRIFDSRGGIETPPSKLDAAIDSNPKLRDHPRVVRYRAALKHAESSRTN